MLVLKVSISHVIMEWQEVVISTRRDYEHSCEVMEQLGHGRICMEWYQQMNESMLKPPQGNFQALMVAHVSLLHDLLRR